MNTLDLENKIKRIRNCQILINQTTEEGDVCLTCHKLAINTLSGKIFYRSNGLWTQLEDSEPTSVIDIQSKGYDIKTSGILEITNSFPGSQIIFPDPSLHEGQEFTIINVGLKGIDIQIEGFGPVYPPFLNGTSTIIDKIATGEMWTFKSINGNWRGGKYS